MKIRIKETYGEGKITSVEDYVESSLDGTDYNHGVTEATARTANNCAEALARLCDILVVYIAEGYKDYDKLEAVDD